MGELKVECVVDIPLGIKADLSDGAIVTMTVEGALCSRCLMNLCRHTRAALPAYEKRKWVLAEANARTWGPGMYASIGIDPRIFNRPGEMPYGPLLPERWSWGDLDMMMFEVDGGFLATFRDGGHLWISERHPLGGTKCLQCGHYKCAHWDRAREEIEAWEAQR